MGVGCCWKGVLRYRKGWECHCLDNYTYQPSAKCIYSTFITAFSVCFSTVAIFPPQTLSFLPLSFWRKHTRTHSFGHFCTAIKRKTWNFFQFLFSQWRVSHFVHDRLCLFVCVKVCKSLRVTGIGFSVYRRSQLIFQAGFPPFCSTFRHSLEFA